MSQLLNITVKEFVALLLRRQLELTEGQTLQIQIGDSSTWSQLTRISSGGGTAGLHAEDGQTCLVPYEQKIHFLTKEDMSMLVVGYTDDRSDAVRLCSLRMQAMQNIPLLSRGEKQRFKAD